MEGSANMVPGVFSFGLLSLGKRGSVGRSEANLVVNVVIVDHNWLIAGSGPDGSRKVDGTLC